MHAHNGMSHTGLRHRSCGASRFPVAPRVLETRVAGTSALPEPGPALGAAADRSAFGAAAFAHCID